MALVQVDLSEYDMLRQAKEKAEKELEKVQKELEGLKNNTSCVIKSRYYMPRLDLEKASKVALNYFQQAVNSPYLVDRMRGYGSVGRLKGGLEIDFEAKTKSIKDFKERAFREAIVQGFRAAHTPDLYHDVSSRMYDPLQDTTEIVGFESVRATIENQLKEEYKELLESKKRTLDSEILAYETKLATLEEEMEDKYKSRISKLQNQIEEMKKEHGAKVDELMEQLKEASKTQAEKVAEAEQKVKEALAELERVKGEKKEEKEKKRSFLRFLAFRE